jgi:hypothetical protein
MASLKLGDEGSCSEERRTGTVVAQTAMTATNAESNARSSIVDQREVPPTLV